MFRNTCQIKIIYHKEKISADIKQFILKLFLNNFVSEISNSFFYVNKNIFNFIFVIFFQFFFYKKCLQVLLYCSKIAKCIRNEHFFVKTKMILNVFCYCLLTLMMLMKLLHVPFRHEIENNIVQ